MKLYNIDQQSEDWFNLRKGKVTGTGLKKLLGNRSRETYLYEIIAERLSVGTPSEENARERGNRLEPNAIEAFEKQTGKIVDSFGMVESDESQFIASSPDGLIKNKGKYDEAVEVKCLNGGHHVKIWLTDSIPEEYYPQVVQYFIVNNDLKKLYFVSYEPSIKVHPLHIIEIERKKIEKDIEKYRKQELEFIAEVEKVLENIIEL